MSSIIKVGNQIVVVDNKLLSVDVSTSPTPTPSTEPVQGDFKVGGHTITLATGGNASYAQIAFPSESKVAIPFRATRDSSTYFYSLTDLDGNFVAEPEMPAAGTVISDWVWVSENDPIIAYNVFAASGNISRSSIPWTGSFGTSSGYNYMPTSIAYDSTNDRIYVGGYFHTYGGLAARRLVCIDGTDGSTYAAFDTTSGFTAATSSYVTGLFIISDLGGTGENLIAIGRSLTTYGGLTIPSNICAITTADGSLNGTFSTAIGTGTGASSDTIYCGYQDVTGKNLYLAMSTTSFGGSQFNKICRINTEIGVLDTDWVPANDGSVFVVSTQSQIIQDPWTAGNIIVVGTTWDNSFTISKADGTATSLSAAYDQQGGLIGDHFKSASSLYRFKPSADATKIYVAGNFYSTDDYHYYNQRARLSIDAQNSIIENDSNVADSSILLPS